LVLPSLDQVPDPGDAVIHLELIAQRTVHAQVRIDLRKLLDIAIDRRLIGDFDQRLAAEQRPRRCRPVVSDFVLCPRAALQQFGKDSGKRIFEVTARPHPQHIGDAGDFGWQQPDELAERVPRLEPLRRLPLPGRQQEPAFGA
jgi:hypothetical protein